MKQGTVSILFGCHSVIHSFLVIISWVKLYKSFPKIWQIICIFIHDVGHIGTDYLDSYEQKKNHWLMGAKIGELFFGHKGYAFLAGHCSHSGEVPSRLYKADKYSWYIAPRWWLLVNIIFEPKIAMGYDAKTAIEKFKEQVSHSIESGAFKSTHGMFLERCNGFD